MHCCKIRSSKSLNEIENTVTYTKSERKASVVTCSYCGGLFAEPELVEHAPRCKEVSRLKAEEFWLKEGLPFSPETGATVAEVNSESTVGREEFERCPNCRELFPLPYLVDHAPNCTSSVSDLNKAIKTATSTGPPSVIPRTEGSIISYDCQFCKIRLPEHVMSKHYPKCKSQHFSNSRSEWSSTMEEGDPEVLTEHLIYMKDPSTRLTIEDGCLPSSAKNWEESTDRKAEDSHGLERISSQYSYCKEQCLYCLKMFAVSVLVEHACDCASRQEVRKFTPA